MASHKGSDDSPPVPAAKRRRPKASEHDVVSRLTGPINEGTSQAAVGIAAAYKSTAMLDFAKTDFTPVLSNIATPTRTL